MSLPVGSVPTVREIFPNGHSSLPAHTLSLRSEHLRAVWWSRQEERAWHPPKSMLAGSNLTLYTLRPATYLEAVPSYVGAVPSVQGINVWMLRVVALLREAEGKAERAAELRAQADALVSELLDRMCEWLPPPLSTS